MSKALNQQVVHESETQRQYVRLPVPAQVAIDGKLYEVKDLSPGGVSLKDVKDGYPVGTKVALVLHLPFQAFSMDLTLNAQVIYALKDQEMIGLEFVDLTREQIALLNHVVKSFLAGEVVATTDLLNVVARDNYTKPRKTAGASAPVVDTKRQIPGLLLVAVLGLAAATFIVGNLYENLFTLKASSAVVKTEMVQLRAVGDGILKSKITPETTIVEAGQVLGSVDGDDIKSPCNCNVTDVLVMEGEYVTAGETLATLVPVNAEPWVVANVRAQDAVKLGADSKVSIAIAGTKVVVPGRITGMKSTMAEDTESALAGFVSNTVQVRIALDQKQPIALAGRPAQVVFEVK